ncbi:MAG: hypothetical protein B7X28_01860 [Halothiobacillus sp. 13-55-253]|jgi:uncharacterized protein involved in response to NO|nr:MAG: hypothetical protein B7X37_01070 [Halothiobacillus sp. 14-55-98]OZB83633.1 MAG: hypothetical protein B7X28_01860 [Halothiobacillus sp. 13-55-253]
MKSPVLFSIGFRPWFLLFLVSGGLMFSAWGLPWLITSTGLHINIELFPALMDWRWHAHEMIYGLGFALLAGFLLTAVQNWTGRRPLPPIGLFVTTAIWLCARGTFLFFGMHSVWAYILSIIPEIIVGSAILVAIIRTGQWHNLLFPFSLLLIAFLDSYFGIHINEPNLQGQVAVMGLWPILAVLLFVSQRIIPAFTAGRAGKRSNSLGNYAAVTFGVAPFVLLLLSFIPQIPGNTLLWSATSTIIILLGCWGVLRWWHPVVRREPMLLVLYAGFALTLAGLLIMTLSVLFFTNTNMAAMWWDAGIHGVGLGILGVLGPGMLLRVSAGHSGRIIVMPNWLRVFFIATPLIWLLRVFAPVLGYNPLMLGLSAWGMAAVYFSLLFAVGPWLVSPRADRRS